jgi:hypothetical protein
VSQPFDLEKFLVDVFAPVRGERVAVVVDRPVPGVPDNDAWRERRAMAGAWREGLAGLGAKVGFETLPLVSFPATGRSGADFPPEGEAAERTIAMAMVLDGTSLMLVLTEFSMTAALCDVCKRRPGADVFARRACRGSRSGWKRPRLPPITRRRSGAAASERRLSRRRPGGGGVLDRPSVPLRPAPPRLRRRRRGYLHRDKNDDLPVINLPSGETFQVPYEGEIAGDPSRTSGELPVHEDGQTVVFRVEANRIVSVIGSGALAERYRSFFGADPARGNVAEVAFGCNDDARVTGNVLEDEKAGFHWAFGRSDHLGGKIGLADFRSPANVVHEDIVYAKGSPIAVFSAELVKGSGRRITVIRDGAYVLW